MKSLKELIEENEGALFHKMSDVEIIRAYLSQPTMLEKAPEILVEILQNQINMYTRLRDNQLIWGTMSFSYYYDDYPKEIASQLVHLTLKHIAEADFSETDLKWLEENVPNLSLKTAFYMPLLQTINGLGFRFKNQTDKNFEDNVRDYKRSRGIW